MQPYEIVLDTNVLVAAARSRRGASYALLQTMTKHKWRMNISSALLLEYESKLKIEAKRQGWPPIIVDEFLDLIAAASHHRQIYFLLRPFLRDPGDDFILELAVASRAQFIVTYNTRDFTQAVEYGVRVVRPQEFLRILENRNMSAIQIELPKPVHERAQKLARAQSMSLDKLMVMALVEKLSVAFPDVKLEERAERGRWNGFANFMDSVPDVEPDEFDKLPKNFKTRK